MVALSLKVIMIEQMSDGYKWKLVRTTNSLIAMVDDSFDEIYFSFPCIQNDVARNIFDFNPKTFNKSWANLTKPGNLELYSLPWPPHLPGSDFWQLKTILSS